MVGELFDKVVADKLESSLASATVQLGVLKNDLVDTLCYGSNGKPKTHRQKFLNWLSPKDLSSLSTIGFARRLADTQVGRMIADEVDAHADILLNDLAQRYEEIGSAASQFFRRRAQLFSMLIGLAVAFVFNVDSINLLRTLVVDETVRLNVISQLEGSLDELPAAPQNGSEVHGEGPTGPASRSSAGQAAADEESTTAQSKLGRGEGKESFERAAMEVRGLQALGLPIGRNFFPWCLPITEPSGADANKNDGKSAQATANASASAAVDSARQYVDSRCYAYASPKTERGLDERLSDTTNLVWFASVLVAGILIGLGAPFWFDIARNLTVVAQLLRGPRGGKTPEETLAAKSGKTAKKSVGETAGGLPTTPLEAFRLAAAAKKIKTFGASRLPDGQGRRRELVRLQLSGMHSG